MRNFYALSLYLFFAPAFWAGNVLYAQNIKPIINSQNSVPVVNEDHSLEIHLADLAVTDPDNTYPDDFTLLILAGDNYTVSDNKITPKQNYNGSLTVNVVVNDGTHDSDPFGFSVTVNSVNDAPQITGQVFLNTDEDTPISISQSNLTILDPDNDTYTLTVLDGSGYTHTGNTVTPALNQSGTITVNVKVNDGISDSNTFGLQITVTATGDKPVITAQNAVSTPEETPKEIVISNLTVTDADGTTSFTLNVKDGTDYTHNGNTITPARDVNGTITVNVTVSDGTLESDVYGLQVTVTPVNDKPVIVGQHPVSIVEAISATITASSVIVDDVDDDTFTLTVKDGTGYTHIGNLVVPAPGITDPLTVNVTVSDGEAESDVYGLLVTILPVNDAPKITGQLAVSTAEEQPVTITLSQLIVQDPDNKYPDDFTLSVLSGTNYTVEGNTITPARNITTTITVNVTVSDGQLSSDVYGLQVTITPVNDAPVITGQVSPLNVNEDQAITLRLNNLTVTDPDNTYPTDFTLTVLPGSHYSVSGNTVTPDLNYNSPLSVPVTVSDGNTSSEPFNVQITVNPVNDAPKIVGQVPLSIGEVQPIELTLAQLTVEDPDNQYPDDFSLNVLSGTNYSVVGNTVTPVANFSGNLQVRVFVNDGTSNSAIFNLIIQVNSVNDAPKITGQKALTVVEDQSITIKLSDLTVTDPDNKYPDDFTLNVLSGTDYAVQGTTVTPKADLSGLLTVRVTVNDGVVDSEPYNLQIQVTPVNDAPVILSQSTLSTNEDQNITLQLNNLTVKDPDNLYPNGFSVIIGTGNNYTASGLTITPNLNYFGTLSVPVRVNDGALNSDVFNVQITVNPVNDAPAITGQTTVTTMEEQPVTIQLSNLIISDPDNNSGFTINIQQGSNYTFSGTTVTPGNDFTGQLTVNLTVSDGAASSASFPFRIQVNSANDSPVIKGQSALTVAEEQSILLRFEDLIVEDPDNTNYPTGFSMIVAPGNNYTLSGASGRTITPAANFNGTLTVSVKVNDGNSDSAPFDVKITVTQVNDAPVITAQAPLSTTEDTPITILLSNLTIVDPDNNTFTLNVLAGEHYTVSGAKVTPEADYFGNLNVGVTVSDGTATSEVFTLLIKVNATNDAPTTKGIAAIAVDEDRTTNATVNLLTAFDDREDGAQGLTYLVVGNDKPGYFLSMDIAQGMLSFKVTPDVFGVAKITIRATDTNGASVQDVLTVTINPINDPPSFDALADMIVYENAAQQTVTIKNISAGPYETQQLLLTASSGNTMLMPQPTVSYNGTASTATISFKPAANQTGTAVITVKVVDTGPSEFTQTFTVQVLSINDAPTLNAITFGPIPEDADLQQIPLSGITAGPQETQQLTVTATTTRPELFQVFEVAYQSPQSTGTLRVKPAANAFGTASITVKVTDDGSNEAPNVNFTTRTFSLVINSVNDLPVITSTPVLSAIVNDQYQYLAEATDADAGDVVTITATQKPAWLTLTSQGNGKALIKGVPPVSATGPNTIKLQAKDKAGATVVQEYTLVVDSRPVVSDFSIAVNEDEAATFSAASFSAAFNDADNNSMQKVQVTALTGRGQIMLGAAAVALHQEIDATALNNLRYVPTQDVNGKDTLLWTASDGMAYAQNSARIVITIIPVNDAPVISRLEETPLEFSVGEGPGLISGMFEVTDVDDDSLANAEIGFRRQNFTANEDVLVFADRGPIKGVYDALSGILTLTGKAPVKDYIDAIRSIQYDNVSNVFYSEEQQKTIFYTVGDGALLSVTRDREIKLIDNFRDLQIPNGFTPNSDGDNDTWLITNIERHPEATVRVYNFMGQEVYTSKADYAGWDGTYKGKVLPSDTYYYTIDLNLNFRKKTYKGAVTILR